MSIKITDPALADVLRESKGGVDITDADGHFLGMFVTEGLYRLPPGFQSKFTEEELERRRQDKTPGRPLKDILRDLEARA